MAGRTEAAVAAGEQLPSTTPSSGEAAGSGIERRRHPRVRIEASEPVSTPPAYIDGDRRKGDRRQGDRREVDRLRASAQWSVAPDRGSRMGRLKGRWSLGMKGWRALVLLVALGAGGIAAYFATKIQQPAAPVTVVAAAKPAEMRVLVATQEIKVGQRLQARMLAWQDWPESGTKPDYVTSTAAPTAINDLSGSFARSEILPGDPIRKQKLASGAESFLPALLDGGMRAVSIPVSAEVASGGFVNPNDRVDVVLTRATPANDVQNNPRNSQTIVRNVRVLAIGDRAGAPSASNGSQNADKLRNDVFVGQAIATLALNPKEAEVVVTATEMGKLSLLLRAASDSADTKKPEDGANEAIRISSRFWSK